MRKNKKSVVTRIVFIMLMVLSFGYYGTTAFANNDTVTPYKFIFEEYGEAINDVSRFDWKDTDSYIRTHCDFSSNSFQVYALGSNSTGDVGDDYADVSHGNRYLLYSGQFANMLNWVYEEGYSNTGIKCIYYGDNYFSARGFFVPDM